MNFLNIHAGLHHNKAQFQNIVLYRFKMLNTALQYQDA